MSFALSSSSDGRSASAFTALTSITVLPIAPPRITSLSFSREYLTETLAALTGSSE